MAKRTGHVAGDSDRVQPVYHPAGLPDCEAAALPLQRCRNAGHGYTSPRQGPSSTSRRSEASQLPGDPASQRGKILLMRDLAAGVRARPLREESLDVAQVRHSGPEAGPESAFRLVGPVVPVFQNDGTVARRSPKGSVCASPAM